MNGPILGPLQAGLALLVLAPAAWGQGPPATAEPARLIAPRPLPSTLRPPIVARAARDTGKVYPRTYWAEGGLSGGIVLGTLSGMLAAGFCAYSETEDDCTMAPVLGFMVGAAVGFPVGSLVGGAIRKPPVDSAGQGTGSEGRGSGLAPLVLSSVLTPVGMAIGAAEGNSAIWTLVGGLLGLATGQFLGKSIR